MENCGHNHHSKEESFLKKKKRKRWGLRSVIIAASIVLVLVLAYALHAAHLITQKMSGELWDIPSRVYAAPEILYPGKRILGEDLEIYLTSQGYERVKGKSAGTGQWLQDVGDFIIGLRGFEGAVEHHEPILVHIAIRDQAIESIKRLDGDPGKQLNTLTLEPVELGQLYSEKREQRTVIELDEFPKTLKDAVLVMEDRNFYTHHGLSFRGIARAAWVNLRGGGIRQGGSTLSQQLVKKLFSYTRTNATEKNSGSNHDCGYGELSF